MPGPDIGVMGGTFDPVHHGHLVVASEVAHRFGLREVVFVPAARPWQKRAHASPEHRYLMTVIATAADPRFRVSRVDIDREGPTYTVDTLRDLRCEYGDEARLHFITGADALGRFHTWHEPHEVMALARLIGVTRPGHELAADRVPVGDVTLAEMPALDISSTDIRERAAAGRPLDYLVPPAVASYIAKHGLYR